MSALSFPQSSDVPECTSFSSAASWLVCVTRQSLVWFLLFEIGSLCVVSAVLELLLCRPGGLRLRDPLVSASQVLAIKACATTSGLRHKGFGFTVCNRNCLRISNIMI